MTKQHFFALILLGVMLILGILSMWGDSAIVDEVAHIPAGFSYLKYGDFRLNPEHPPLIKDLASIPLLFLKLEFPLTIPAWTSDTNGQWETGWHFIYHIGNNADKILFFSRLPILLLAIVFGYAIYIFTRNQFGENTGLLAVFLYALSPNILAHARFVTTDLGIAAFIFFAFIFYFRFLRAPTWGNLWVATLFFALMQLAKFSAVILYPFFGLLAIIAVLCWDKPQILLHRAKLYLGGLVFIFVVSFLMIWAFYIPHTINMPVAVQDQLIAESLKSGPAKGVGPMLMKLNDLPLGKSIAEYILGVAMVLNRVDGGNTTYFLGEVSNQSFRWYFPLSYLIKTPLAELILLVIVLVGLGLRTLSHIKQNNISKLLSLQYYWLGIKKYTTEHFVEMAFLLFIIFYSYLSITGNLNLGIRHLFPILPLIMILVAKGVVSLISRIKNQEYKFSAKLILGILLVWYAGANFWIFPSYVAYFNELIGGPGEADQYVSDSSLDWGQDLKRLHAYVNTHPEIKKIAVDYFGGGYTRYYFCDRKYDISGAVIPNVGGYDCDKSPFIEWHAEYGRPPTDYIAVSETFLTNDLFWSKQRGDTGYEWLRAKEPIAKIGYSIYVYKIN